MFENADQVQTDHFKTNTRQNAFTSLFLAQVAILFSKHNHFNNFGKGT